MEEPIEIRLMKNTLDNKYKFESQKALACFTLGTITLIGFIALMIVQKLYLVAVVMGFMIMVFARVLYKNSTTKMKIILQDIEDLKYLKEIKK